MTPRSIRRAAERNTLKAARKAASRPQTNSSEPVAAATPEVAEEPTSRPKDQVSDARLAANLANAQLSTGPRSSAGKAAVSLNALKSGLTGITVLLCGEERPAYERHLTGYRDEFQPQTARERALVQSIADSAWRILRIAHLEMSYHAAGHIRFSDKPHIASSHPSARPSMIEMLVEETYAKELRNLRLQDSRLHRRSEKDLAELRRTIAERKANEQEQLRKAAESKSAPQPPQPPVPPVPLGFEFATGEPALVQHACAAATATPPEL